VFLFSRVLVDVMTGGNDDEDVVLVYWYQTSNMQGAVPFPAGGQQ